MLPDLHGEKATHEKRRGGHMYNYSLFQVIHLNVTHSALNLLNT